jgi:hypothetical protein
MIMCLRKRPNSRNIRVCMISKAASAALLSIGLAACVFGPRTAYVPKPQPLDLDAARWSSFTFSEDAITVTVKVPPRFRIVKTNRLPEATYDQASQRLLLDAQYDFGKQSHHNPTEFHLRAQFVRLTVPLTQTPLNAAALYGALRAAAGRPAAPGGTDPKPVREQGAAREWMHLDPHAAAEMPGAVREDFYTMIDETSVLGVTATYSPNVQDDPQWFASRRRILRAVVDQIVVTR